MKALSRGLLMALTIGILIVNVGWAARTATLTKSQDFGIVTYKFALKTDSLSTAGLDTLGTYHWSRQAMKTEWVDVPFGIPYAVYVETADADSSKPWGPDTVGLALETAPALGLAVDSAAAQYKRSKADVIWELRSVNFTAFTSQHYISPVFVDSLPNDTIAIAAASLKGTMAYKQATPFVNMGKLRFSLSMDGQDSIQDARIRLNVYIVFQAPEAVRYHDFSQVVSAGSVYACAEPALGVFDERAWAWKDEETH